MASNLTLTGGVSKFAFPDGSTIGKKLLNSLNSALKATLFIEALRNLNWSRGYCWYVEMDGVPNPFQRGGVLGLPVTDVTFTLAEGRPFTWTHGVNQFSVPQGIQTTTQIQLSLMDDEQGTLRQFFERWYNQVYNPYYGVLPVTEACKQISIYFKKSTRRNVKRVYYNLDTPFLSLFGNGVGRSMKESDSMDFLVYPTNTFQMNLSTTTNDLIKFSVTLEVALFINQDFGIPGQNNGVKTLFNQVIGKVSNGDSWLDKIADYI